MNSCELCGSRKDLETHHIHEQRLANDNNYIGHIPKNSKGNMVVLCGRGTPPPLGEEKRKMSS